MPLCSFLFALCSFLSPQDGWSRSSLNRGWCGWQVVGIVDIFTMSCRALGRGVEHALLSEVARQARSLSQARPLTEATPLKSSSASSRAATPPLPPAEGLLLFRYKTRPDLRNAVNPCRFATGVRRVSSRARGCYSTCCGLWHVCRVSCMHVCCVHELGPDRGQFYALSCNQGVCLVCHACHVSSRQHSSKM